jgi:carbon monoxide dehydrogenase subunit G
MTKIDSKKVMINASAEVVYTFLSDMNNIQQLLPDDKISDWKSDEKSCSFKVQGSYLISLHYQSGTPHSLINYSSGTGSPFKFTLSTYLLDTNGATESYLHCEASINPFLEMMVKSPLKNLFDYMAQKLTDKYAAA